MVNVDTVYKTVLYILNKEQRGYITPDEFNRLGVQVQREIFEQYFEELNQQLRIPQTDNEYANRIKNLEEKIAIFEIATNLVPPISGNTWSLPTKLHRIGTIVHAEKAIQAVNRNEYFLINKSPLTKPTTANPLYILKGLTAPAAPPSEIEIYPAEINTDVTAYYVKAPDNPVWAFTTIPFGQPGAGAYVYDNSANSTNFELHPTEQTNIILNILMYSGVIIRDPQIVQTAAGMIQQDEALEKQ
jgi:hypothetical protein